LSFWWIPDTVPFMKIYVKKVEGVTLPAKGTNVAAGYDIVATSDPKIVGKLSSFPNTYTSIDYIEYETNLFIAPSALSFHTLIHPRSSVSKYNLVLANSIGLVDNDYRGMVICRFKYIHQPEDLLFSVDAAGALCVCNGCVVNPEKIYKKGDKIAQLVAAQTVGVEWEFVDDLTKTDRDTGGFGSTDTPKGKTLVNVFAEEYQKSSPILEKYKQAGGIPTKMPYSEQVKQREQR
jgi:dUTP pyrophosphatase